MRLAVVVLVLGAGGVALGQSPATSQLNADSVGRLPAGFTQQARDFGRYQPENYKVTTILLTPPMVGPSDAGKAKAEPIPTQWPNAKVEPIPTHWAGLKMLPIDAGKPIPTK
jgi:hypothetical protein